MGTVMRPIDTERMKIIDDAIQRKKLIADGYPEKPFTTQENMMIYEYPAFSIFAVFTIFATAIRAIVTSLLYEKYVNCMNQRVIEKVLPAVVNEQGTTLLANLINLWSEFKEFAQSVAKLFYYLDRFYVPRKKLAPLSDIPKHCFCNLVCEKIPSNLQDATMSLVIEEREGKRQMDRDLLKSVFEFFGELEQKGKRNYYDKIELLMIAEATAYYSQLSMQWWFWCDSFSNYMRKVDWCFVQEERRAEVYPRENTKTKLIEVMRYILLERNAKKLAAKRQEEGFIAPEVEELVAKYGSLCLD